MAAALESIPLKAIPRSGGEAAIVAAGKDGWYRGMRGGKAGDAGKRSAGACHEADEKNNVSSRRAANLVLVC